MSRRCWTPRTWNGDRETRTGSAQQVTGCRRHRPEPSPIPAEQENDNAALHREDNPMISDCHDAGRLGSPDFAPGGPAHQAHVMEPRRTLSGPEQAPLQRGGRGIHVLPGGNQNSGIRTGRRTGATLQPDRHRALPAVAGYGRSYHGLPATAKSDPRPGAGRPGTRGRRDEIPTLFRNITSRRRIRYRSPADTDRMLRPRLQDPAQQHPPAPAPNTGNQIVGQHTIYSGTMRPSETVRTP